MPETDIKNSYPSSVMDHYEMNRVLRHKLRNLCAGVRMTVDRIAKVTRETHPDIPARCNVINNELDGIQKLTDRMDFLFDELPAPEPQSLFDVVSGLREFFVKKYPLCNMELNGPQAGIVLKHGSWFTLALKELLDNAGEAAGAEGRVSFSWKVKGAMEFFVQNEGAQIPPSIRFDPPCPFLTSKSRHEGLGLAVAYRICSQTGSEFKIKNTGGKVIASMKLPEREVAE